MRKHCKLCDSAGSPHARRCAIAAALAILVASCASFKHLTSVGETFPSAKDCGKCHVDIYHEWSESDHAHAYTNPHFRSATNDYSFEDCLNCHAPEPTLTVHTPSVRTVGREEAVTCVACHLDQGELCGPLKPTGRVRPHPIGVRPEVYYSTGICGRCHEGTLKECDSAPADKRTCQQCHMEPITRKITQATGGISNILVAMEHEAPQRRHLFAIPTTGLTDEMIELEIQRLDAGVEVRLLNNLPHSLPTGDFGLRVLVVEISVVDSEGMEHTLASEELAPETKTAIAPHGTWIRSIATPPGSATIRVRLRRLSYEDQPILELLDQTVGL